MEKESKIHKQIMTLFKDATDQKHLECINLHDMWFSGLEVHIGDVLMYDGKLYRCLRGHTCAEEFSPEKANYLWVEITNPSIEFPEWKQPLGYADAYKKGDKVTCDGKKYISDVDGNTWKPGEYGWTEV